MTLYLHSSITPATIAEAAAAGISGVKVYPQGVTTNSDRGVLDLESYYPVFAAMQEHDLVLNLHGEVPSTPVAEFAVRSHEPDGVVTVLNAEQRFLPVLRKLHTAFPNLRIVLEHCSTREALQVVRDCGPTVAATITAHHLWSTTESWCGNAYNYCKPVPKTPEDRLALVRAVMLENKGKFFFGKFNGYLTCIVIWLKGTDVSERERFRTTPYPSEANRAGHSCRLFHARMDNAAGCGCHGEGGRARLAFQGRCFNRTIGGFPQQQCKKVL